ncbi:hypothetical protein JG687_00011263 [Phytophthora cactorum]|uniref:Uncharacterized protein n=1 Tax=Phytophthora cactorum TaxID=29920 RepID=A0A8T1U530_9STRA|nr:hypothetical protein JG687_00011263 [Phytophthora cactorum]
MEGYPRWISGFPDSRTLTTSDGLGGHEIPRIVHERISLARELGASASHSWFFSLDANVTFRYTRIIHICLHSSSTTTWLSTLLVGLDGAGRLLCTSFLELSPMDKTKIVRIHQLLVSHHHLSIPSGVTITPASR